MNCEKAAPNQNEKGTLLVISGPSGVGKSTLTRRLLAKPERALSVSATTRAIRDGESDYVDYLFVPREEFERLVRKDWFAEYAEVHGNYYGTPLRPLQEALRAGLTFLLDIDVQGAGRIKERFPEAVTVLILPPSMDALEARLRERKTDSEETIQRRLANAPGELARKNEFDFCVVNDDLGAAVSAIEALLCEREK